MIENLRKKLIDEAMQSPSLFADWAGLETYISESDINRSFIELLQNADDAKALRFYVEQYDDALIVANDGRPFELRDVESLCRSAASGKQRGSTIGYRGIGFKSVVNIANEVSLISGEFAITYSRELTRKIMPKALKVPLVRIPHPLKNDIYVKYGKKITWLLEHGYTTLFILTGINRDLVQDDFAKLSTTSFLFLNNVQKLALYIPKNEDELVEIKKVASQIKDFVNVFVQVSDKKYQWCVWTNNACSIAFEIRSEIVRIPQNNAIIHAFLPTEDISGLGVLLNGDFSTDPSRRHLIVDESTKLCIMNLADMYSHLLKECLLGTTKQAVKLVAALVPYVDLRLVNLGGNAFLREFAPALKKCLGELKITQKKICPSWFNYTDFQKLFVKNDNDVFNAECIENEGLISLLKFIGCVPASLESILLCLNTSEELSVNGYAQIFSMIVKRTLLNQSLPDINDYKLIIAGGQRMSIRQLRHKALPMDSSYAQLLYDNGLTSVELEAFLKRLGLPVIDKNIDKKACLQWYNTLGSSQNDSNLGMKKWRTVEENALTALNRVGFNLHDVTKQNVGYDLEGTDPNGNLVFIEVKSIDFVGQNFRMTNNEYAVAQYRKEKYLLAIVLQAGDTIKINIIKNPVNTLQMERQCIQWVWECSSYSFNPLIMSV